MMVLAVLDSRLDAYDANIGVDDDDDDDDYDDDTFGSSLFKRLELSLYPSLVPVYVCCMCIDNDLIY